MLGSDLLLRELLLVLALAQADSVELSAGRATLSSGVRTHTLSATQTLWIVPTEQTPADALSLGRVGSAFRLVRSDARQIIRGAALTPALKISPHLRQKLSQPGVESEWSLTVITTSDRNPLSVVGVLRQSLTSATISLDFSIQPAAIRVALENQEPQQNQHRVNLIAGLDSVVWVEAYTPPQRLNSSTVGPIQANADSGGQPPTATPIWDQGIIGSRQIIAIADSGLDRNEGWFTRLDQGSGTVTALTDAQFTQPPLPGAVSPANKVLGYFVMPGATAYDNNAPCGIGGNAFHGTHVTGTAAGDSGTASTPTQANHDPGDGMAPQSQILFQDLGDDIGGCLTGEGGGPMWAQAKAVGARIHSNSYGGPFTGSYNLQDFAVDEFLWRNEDMLLLFAAGNAGGQPGDQRVFHFGHAKHGLTVAANNRGNNATVWPQSSRGPASDGRLKPDISAPGVMIQSAAGDLNDTGLEPALTTGFSGTSMSTPAVAGAAALVRQYFGDGFYPTGVRNGNDVFEPSGVLLKALLLGGTRTRASTPQSDDGWGRVWLDNNLYFSGDARQLRLWDLPNMVGLTQGDSFSVPVTVPGGQPLRATLVWYDPPPSFIAPIALVNNLDLSVSSPTQTFLGNAIVGGESVTGGSADAINPVEQVMLSNPEAGTYTVTVSATNVPGNVHPDSQQQGFALLVSAAQCDTAVIDPPAFTLATDAAGITLSVDDVAGAQGYQVYRRDGNCGDSQERFLGYATGGEFVDAMAQGGLSYAYRIRAVDGCGEGPVSACRSLLSEGACTLTPQTAAGSIELSGPANFCAAQLSWPEATASCPDAQVRYEVHRDTDPFFTPGAATRIAQDLTRPGFSDPLPTPGVTHYYRYVAVDTLGNRAPPSAPVPYAAISNTTEQPGPYQDGAEALSLALVDGPWQITSMAANSGGRSYLSANPGQNYPDNTCAALTSRPMTLGADSVLSFAAQYNLEADFDGVVVEVSVDGGTWQDLPPDGGYPGVFALTGSPPLNACQYANSQRAFNGDSGGSFVTRQSDLSRFAGRQVEIRWRLSSDTFLSGEGFFLDDVMVTNATQPAECVAGEWIYGNGFE
ncbi:MAG: S8 family serine peptidase [Lysobacterales bacterium]